MHAIIVGRACEDMLRITKFLTLSKIKRLVSLRGNKSRMQQFMGWF